MHRAHSKTTTYAKSTLYAVVFECVYVKCAIAFLFGAFLLQPIAPAYANEIAKVGDAPTPEEVATETPEEVEEVVVEEEKQEVAVAVEDVELEETPSEETMSESEEIAETDEELGEDTVDEVSEVTDLEEGGEIILGESSSEESANENSTAGEEEDMQNETTEDSLLESSETTATSTDEESDTSVEDIGDQSSQSGSDSVHETGDGLQNVATTTTSATTTNELASSTSGTETDTTSTTTEVDTTEDVSDEIVEKNNDENISKETDVTDDAEVIATTTTETPIAVEAVHNSDANKYQFSADECVSVGDGSFYCSKPETDVPVRKPDEVYATQGAGGDKEIFMRKDGLATQITNNSLDDDAPFYDQISDTIVWHRLINGRYEIVSYSLDNKEEIILTQNDINDMEPQRAGDYTVWQRWVEDNWEIVLHDGETENVITDNDTHDVAPHVKGGYVIWHTSDTAGKRTVSVYEIATGLMSTINDEKGGLVENPRFVLVYDTTYDTGEIVTKGYDFESGEVMPLSAIPPDLPEEIPPPDATGETRALIQNKSTSTKEEIVSLDDEITGSSTPSTTATTSEQTTLADISIALVEAENNESASTTLDLRTENEEVLPLTEFDVIVEPFEVASSTQEGDSATSTDPVE